MARAYATGGAGATGAGRPLIRTASPADAEAVARVHVVSWREAYREHLPADLLAALSVERRAAFWREHIGNVLVAERDGAVVAFASVGPSDADASVGQLYAIYADPEHWRTGAGRALMDSSLDRLRELGFREAILWVLDGNERAERFYRLAGWEREEIFQTEEFGGTPVREVRYRRSL